jgi:flagellar biosynthesis protein FliR
LPRADIDLYGVEGGVEPLINFIVLGALGGLLRILMHTESLSEALTYANSKWVLVGAITGLAYYFLYLDYNFPNHLMALIAGYSGADFIEAGSKRFSKVLRELLKP